MGLFGPPILKKICFVDQSHDNQNVVEKWKRLTLKGPRKNAFEKLRLLKSSAANNCLTLLTNLSREANRVDPDQTAPIGPHCLS